MATHRKQDAWQQYKTFNSYFSVVRDMHGASARWLVLLGLLSFAIGDEVTLHLPGLGILQGSLNTTSWSNRTIFQFQGIPFAKPPVGNLRFQPPETAGPWRGILDATKFQRKCPTVDRLILQKNKNSWKKFIDDDDIEDCLHINVYTTKLGDHDDAQPVMVYFHGGSFRTGSAQDFWPNYLLEKDVVLVVPQYRLGPLGFLSLQTDAVPGNVGLLDQVLALKWVNKYISYFNGDPNRVTIFGQSAGAASVTLLQISPLVDKGLFKQVIAQSGTGLATWVIDSNPVRSARAIAKYANCSQENIQELTNCLMKVPAQNILLAHAQLLMENYHPTGERPWGGNHAVIQTTGTQKFLVEPPLKSVLEGRYNPVPMMGGVVRQEGSFIVGTIYETILRPYRLLNNNDYLKHNLTRATLKFSGIADPTGMVSDILNEKYFKPGELGNFTAMTHGLIDICGVALLKAGVFRTVLENSRLQSSFLYSFNYYGKKTKFGYGENVNYPFTGGVSHSDDLIYLFPEPGANLDPEDEEIAKTMVELWTNFATYGKPTPAVGIPEWPTVTTEKGPYLRIDEKSIIRDNFIDEYAITITEGLNSPSMTSKTSTVTPTIVVILAMILASL